MASGDDFSVSPCCITYNVDAFCASTDADRVLGIDRVYEKKLIDIGEGIMI